MMLHGSWTYGTMKTDGGDFVSGGHLGYMNFPPVDGGKGDPTDTVGNPGQYLSISSKATDAQKDDREEVLRHRGARRRRGQGVDRHRRRADREGARRASSAGVEGRRLACKFVYDVVEQGQGASPQSWDQALQPDRRPRRCSTTSPSCSSSSITPQQFADNMNEIIGTVTALAPPGARTDRPARTVSRRRAAARSVAWMALPALVVFVAFGVVPAARRARAAQLHHVGRHRRDPRRPASPAGRSVLTDPGLPHSLWVTFLVMVLSWLVQTPMSILLGVFLAGRQRYRAAARRLLLHPAAAELGGDRDHLQGAARPQLRARRRAGHPAAARRTGSGKPTLAHRRGHLHRVLAVHPVPLADLPGRGAADPALDVRGGRHSTAPGGCASSSASRCPQLKYTIITSSTLMVVGSLTFFDLIFVLTAGGPADATRVLALDMYKRGFQANLMGPASVIAVILVLVGLALALVLRRLGGGDGADSQLEGRVTTTGDARRADDRSRRGAPARAPAAPRTRPNWLGGLAGWLWLAIVLVPIYWIVITSFKTQSDYFSDEPVRAAARTRRWTTTALVIADGLPALLRQQRHRHGRHDRAGRAGLVHGGVRDRARGSGRFLSSVNALFLHGAGDPAAGDDHPGLPDHHQARDSTTRLLAIILPSIAFAIPLSVLVLANFIRDVPERAVRVDAGRRGERVDDAVAAGVPADPAGPGHRDDLQRPDHLERLPAAADPHPEPRQAHPARWRCGSFQGQYSVNVPAVLASVVLTTLPILVLYAVGRRQLLSGLTAGFGK